LWQKQVEIVALIATSEWYLRILLSFAPGKEVHLFLIANLEVKILFLSMFSVTFSSITVKCDRSAILFRSVQITQTQKELCQSIDEEHSQAMLANATTFQGSLR
jgi:hypothetical protein